MLGKLIKHEFRATGRLILPMLAAVLALSVLAGASVKSLEASQSFSFVETLSTLALIAFVVALIAVCVAVFVQMIERFYKSLLGSEGYLFFTLPTTPDAIIWSRLIVSSVWFIATSVLCFIGILIMTIIGVGAMELDISDLPGAINELLKALGDGSVAVGRAHCIAYIFEFIVVSFAGCCVTCLQFYAPISIGYSFSNRKGLLSVVFFFAIQIVANILGVMLINTGILDTLANFITPINMSPAATVHWFMLGLFLTELVNGAILYAITSLFLRKRLNLP